MKLFEEEYIQDLREINNRLKEEYNQEKTKELLNDRQTIINYLNNLTSFQYKNILDKKMVSEDICSYKFCNIKLNNIKIFHNNPQIINIFNKFLQEDEFKIKRLFEYVKSYNGIKLTNKKNPCYYGATSFFPSLNKNYIEINKIKRSYINTSTLIHELGHAKINSISLKNEEIDKKNLLKEAYPIFLELMFADYLKDNGMLKECYNLKKDLLLQLKIFYIQLRGELYAYMEYNEKRLFDIFCFESKYIYLKGSLLALEFYFNYINNKKNTLETIDKFISGVKGIDNNELLNLLNINFSNSRCNENIEKFSSILKNEEEKIKKCK